MSKCISQHWPSQDAATNNSKCSHCKIMKTYFLSYLQTQWRWTREEWCPVTECPAACHSTAFCLIFIVCVCPPQRTISGVILTVHPVWGRLYSYSRFASPQTCRDFHVGTAASSSWVLGIQNRVLKSAQWVLYPLGHLSHSTSVSWWTLSAHRFSWATINEQPSASKVCRRVT